MTVQELLRHPLVQVFAMAHMAIFAAIVGALVTHVLALRRKAKADETYQMSGKNRRMPDPQIAEVLAGVLEIQRAIKEDLLPSVEQTREQTDPAGWRPVIENTQRIVEMMEPIGLAARALADKTLQQAIERIAGK